MLSTWSSIRDTAEALRSHLQPYSCGRSNDCGSTDLVVACPVTLDLSIPQDFQVDAVSLGLPRDAGEKVSSALLKAISGLQAVSRSNFYKAWQQLESLDGLSSSRMSKEELASRLRDAHQLLFRRQVSAWKRKIEDLAVTRVQQARLAQCQERDAKGTKGTKQPFNQDFIPFLEICFAKNERPSRAEKELLAEKSGMSFRQINVWFQNRRSRSKKTERLDTGEPEICDPMASRVADCHTCSKSSLITRDAFSSRAPSYAFPTAYSSELVSLADPFPCRFGDFSFFGKPCWSRQPTSRPREAVETDLSALCLAFADLRIGDASQCSSQEKSNRTENRLRDSWKETGSDSFSPYTVRPLRAPLMSLIRNFASRVVHLSGKLSDDVQRSQLKVASAPTVEFLARAAQRKTRRRQAPASHRSAVSADQNSAPSACSPNEPTSFSTPNSSVATTCSLTMDQPSKVKKSTRNSSSSQRVPAASTSKRTKGRSAPIVKATEPSSEPPIVHPSPTASVDSLPSLSYSSESSSASTCSQSPTTSFGVLPDNDLLPSLDPYQPSRSSLTLPLAPTVFEDFPSQMFPPSDISFDFSRGPLDYTFNLDLPSYPSYSESFDSISQGLQSSPDFPPPGLTLDSFSFAV